MQLSPKEVDRIIINALEEDLGRGDITSYITIPENTQTSFTIKARESLIASGINVAKHVFEILDPSIIFLSPAKDGDKIKKNGILLSGEGNAQSILSGERVALNLLGLMCSVATTTHKFVEKTKGTKAKILDTRKTIPGLRELLKYSVRIGGGYNHRFRLDDGILIKDNHISICGNIKKAVNKARKESPNLTRIEVECETLEQVKEALAVKADIILLDNMNLADIKKSVNTVKRKIPLEASGNVTLTKVTDIAKTGVDFISVGSITSSPINVDIGLDIDL